MSIIYKNQFYEKANLLLTRSIVLDSVFAVNRRFYYELYNLELVMNIFFLDNNVDKCAEYHCDKHIVKMVLETAQLLCSAHWVCGNTAPYKLAHKNHPCSIWVRSSLSNYIYLCNLGLALCDEYEYRYNKVHKSKQVIIWCLENVPKLKDIGFTAPALAMPEQYKSADPVKSYRDYYINEKSFAKWKIRQKPFWYNKQ